MIQILPDTYRFIEEAEVHDRILRAKEKLGDSLIILGHHYQRAEIIKYSHIRGDSFGLSQQASQTPRARYIVFCGVNFMAESAAILCRPQQKVLHPDPFAGCPLAEMAPLDQVEEAWQTLTAIYGPGLCPIVYMNSFADLKSFCGRRGGAVCTSSNARAVFEWAFKEKGRIFFFPDEHLGRNTAHAFGLAPEEMAVWDPDLERGGNSLAGLQRARVILWKGYCHVHLKFTPQHILAAKAKDPSMKILVHPECTREVVELSDLNGSTGFIVKQVENSPPGSAWGIGTELNLVSRLAQENQDKKVLPLARSLCPNMYRINTHNLLWVLEGLLEGQFYNQVTVKAEEATGAKEALVRMLALK